MAKAKFDIDPKIMKVLSKTDNTFRFKSAAIGALAGAVLGFTVYFICKNAVKQGRLEYDIVLDVVHDGACAAKDGES